MFLKARLFLSTLSLLRVLRSAFMETCNGGKMNVTFLIGDHWAYVTVPVDTKDKLESVCSAAVLPLFRIMYRPV